MDDVFYFVFGVLMALVAAWFVLLKVMFVQLEKKHPDKYKQMGEPSVFWNNSVKTGYETLKFLGRREHKSLGSPGFSKLCDFALLLLVVYLVLFVGLLIGVISNSIPT